MVKVTTWRSLPSAGALNWLLMLPESTKAEPVAAAAPDLAAPKGYSVWVWGISTAPASERRIMPIRMLRTLRQLAAVAVSLPETTIWAAVRYRLGTLSRGAEAAVAGAVLGVTPLSTP